MAAPKAKTIQERFGFMDKELTAPKHDEIMLWLDANMGQILPQIVEYPKNWKPKDIEQFIEKAEELVQATYKRLQGFSRSVITEQKIIKTVNGWEDHWESEEAFHSYFSSWQGLGTPPERGDLEILGKAWEYPVTTGRDNKFIVGFLDMMVSFFYPELDIDSTQHLPRWSITEGAERRICFEVKTAIPSLGELFRQIRMYQEYIHCPIVVVCPDDRFAEQIRSQGIKFLKYPYANIRLEDSQGNPYETH